jgi:hypothetical protein
VPVSSGSKPRSTNDVVKSSGEVWTKPEAGDPDYNPAKDNTYYRTGYRDPDGSGDWTGGQAREDDLHGDFDKYVPPSERKNRAPEPEPDAEPVSDPDPSQSQKDGPDSSSPPQSNPSPRTEQSDLDPWERVPSDSQEPDDDEDDSEPEASYDALNQAAMDGMMENEGRPPDFKDNRSTATSDEPRGDEPAEVDGTPASDPDESNTDTVPAEPEEEQPASDSKEPQEAADEEETEDETTDEAKESTDAHSINTIWASWEDTLTKDSEDESAETDSDDTDTTDSN